MSWWIYLRSKECEHCGASGQEFFNTNYTSNMWPMLHEARFDWDPLEGKTAEEIEPEIERLIGLMTKDPAAYRALNPKNGWGNYDSFLREVLRPLLEACKENPKAIFHISR
jgi:hypothetical protein